MAQLRVRERDIVESFIRSPGAGGQHVNKVSSCVYLKHLPTGIEVKCHQGRSQHANRLRAREILLEKIAGRRAAEERIRQKRRQKKRLASGKRPRHVKERILKDKKEHSRKKRARARLDPGEYR